MKWTPAAAWAALIAGVLAVGGLVFVGWRVVAALLEDKAEPTPTPTPQPQPTNTPNGGNGGGGGGGNFGAAVLDLLPWAVETIFPGTDGVGLVGGGYTGGGGGMAAGYGKTKPVK